jgi:hypothetical protein
MGKAEYIRGITLGDQYPLVRQTRTIVGDALTLLTAPAGLTAVTRVGKDYYLCGFDNKIYKLSAAGVLTVFAGSGVGSSLNGVGVAATFNYPIGIVADPSESYLYVTEYGGQKLRRIEISTATVTTLNSLSFLPTAPVYNAANNSLYFGSFAGGGSGIYRFNLTTNTLVQLSSIGGSVYSLALINKSIYYVAVNGIWKAGLDGTGSVQVAGSPVGSTGSADGVGTAATFNTPFGILSDGGKNLFIADYTNNKIRQLNLSTLAVKTVAGSGAAANTDGFGAAAAFNGPQGLGLAADLSLIVCQSTIPQLRIVT